jgi:D-arginine dehydrogenase
VSAAVTVPADVVVIGGGMAGVSIGFELTAGRSVVVLDMEATLAYHTTGRSAAMFLESYGAEEVRALTVTSRAFLTDLGALAPMPTLFVGGPGRGDAVDELYAQVRDLAPGVALLDEPAARRQQPLLRPGAIERALFEPDATEIDVHAVHQHYVHGLRERGATIRTRARVIGAEPHDGGWLVRTTDETFVTPVVVNAAGAWADHVAGLFGVAPVGLRPLRRSAFVADAPPGTGAPMIADIDDRYYVKPERGRVLCSPSEETPHDPGDARADEVEIARAIDAINEVTTLGIRHVRSQWGGLRSFVADRRPVVGYGAPGFFWFAGQGGYGIQMAPALARTGAALVRGEPVPADVAVLGLTAAALSPARPA